MRYTEEQMIRILGQDAYDDIQKQLNAHVEQGLLRADPSPQVSNKHMTLQEQWRETRLDAIKLSGQQQVYPTLHEDIYAKLAYQVINREGTWPGPKADIEIRDKMLNLAFDKKQIYEAIQNASPETRMNDVEQYMSQIISETGLKASQIIDDKVRRTEDIMNFSQPKFKNFTSYEYLSQAKEQSVNGWPGAIADEVITKNMLIKGVGQNKIVNVLVSRSPEFAGKTPLEARKLANEMVQKIAKQPEVNRAIKQHVSANIR